MNGYQNFKQGHFKPFTFYRQLLFYPDSPLKAFMCENDPWWHHWYNSETNPPDWRRISKTNEEADGFITLLTQDQVEQELIHGPEWTDKDDYNF